MEYEYYTITPDRFFGVEEIWVDEHFRVPIYDRERSLLDCFATPRHFGGLSEALGILEERAGELDLEKLAQYALRYFGDYRFSDYARLTPNLKRARLEAGSKLFDIGSTSDHAWFITAGISSLFTTTEAGDIIEAAAVGREGVVGLSGITRRIGMACLAQVQISGEALQIGVKTLQSMLEQEVALYKPLFEYTHALSEQIALTITCNRFHNQSLNQVHAAFIPETIRAVSRLPPDLSQRSEFPQV